MASDHQPISTKQRIHLATRLDLVTLRLFVAVVEEASILKAAEREHIAPSAVSKRIADLEHAAQTQLLHRHRKGVQTTEAGHAMLHHARIILRDVGQLESEILDFAAGVRGLVRLAASESALFGYFPDALRSFARKYPDIAIDLSAQTSQATVTAVLEGSADIGIFWADVPTGELRIIPCYSDRLVVVAGKSHPLAASDTLKFGQVLDHEIIEQEPESAIQALLTKKAASQGRVMRTHIRVAGYDAVCRMVQAGLGLGIVPSSYAARLSPSLDVVPIALDEDWVDRYYKICARRTEELSVAGRLLLDHLIAARS
jgi:DNA-binding transcriptional LysR family regulator